MHKPLKTYYDDICLMNEKYVLKLCLFSTAFKFDGIQMQLSLCASPHFRTCGIVTVMISESGSDAVVYGYGNFAFLIHSESFSLTPCPIDIRKFKIMYSDIQSKSEPAQSIAH